MEIIKFCLFDWRPNRTLYKFDFNVLITTVDKNKNRLSIYVQVKKNILIKLGMRIT